ncbi:MAG TPA: SRPBCC family protein [Acidobacteriaceae bacterium]|nr:SRPBCC family protein [Acidobacteriaceae bacterium]
MRYSYQTEQWLPYPLENVFEFFADPENLPLLMPEWQDAHIDEERIVPPPPRLGPSPRPEPKAAGTGSRITLSFVPFPYAPMRMRWVAEISDFVWNERFCDRQLEGPFAYWNHCHYLSRAIRGGISGTLIADDLEYDLPYGFLGRLAHTFVLRHQIERIFFTRHIQLATMLARITFPSLAQQSAP